MARRPNILLFMPDQLRADALGCFGNSLAQTPNVDRLAARGVRFTDAWVNHPVCSPSRVSLMTGWYPHVRGHRTLTHLVQGHEPNLLAQMRTADYTVAFAGARGDVFAPGVTEASTDFCGWTVKPDRAQMGMGPQFPEDSPLYHAFFHGRRPGEQWLDFDEAVTRTALEFLAAAPSDPWFLWMPMIFPHLPFEVEGEWLDRFDADAMPAPRRPADGKPAFHRALHARAHLGELSLPEWQEIIRTYYAMTTRVDAQLGRVMAALERSGQIENTLIIFLSDHGEYLGDFGLVEKWPAGMEPCLTRNPLIMAGAGVAEGRTCDALVEMIDLLPTCLDLAGTAAAHTHFGRSLVPLMEAPDTTWARDAAFTEGGFHTSDAHLFEEAGGEYALKAGLQKAQPELVGKCVAMRTKEWTYVHRLEEADELYDRSADPEETVNLLASELGVHEGRVAELRARMLDWHLETSDVIPWTADPRFPRIPHGFHAAHDA